MTQERMIQSFDERIMELLADFYDSTCPARYRAIIHDRIREDLCMAHELGAIDYDDYDHINCVIAFMDTDVKMEDRLW